MKQDNDFQIILDHSAFSEDFRTDFSLSLKNVNRFRFPIPNSINVFALLGDVEITDVVF